MALESKSSIFKVPFLRLPSFALEATLAYVFWAMKANYRNYAMGHIYLWTKEFRTVGVVRRRAEAVVNKKGFVTAALVVDVDLLSS